MLLLCSIAPDYPICILCFSDFHRGQRRISRRLHWPAPVLKCSPFPAQNPARSHPHVSSKSTMCLFVHFQWCESDRQTRVPAKRLPCRSRGTGRGHVRPGLYWGPPTFKGCGSVLTKGFLPLVKQRRVQLVLVAQIRNRHVFDEVFAQDGHFLLRGELSASVFHGDPLDAPLSSALARHFQFRLKLYRSRKDLSHIAPQCGRRCIAATENRQRFAEGSPTTLM